jgi:MFS family permease
VRKCSHSFLATTWGSLADIIGRRLSWNITLFIAGVFGIAAGGAPSFAALGTLLAFLGFGIGGNLPVDGALYLEFIPQVSNSRVTRQESEYL